MFEQVLCGLPANGSFAAILGTPAARLAAVGAVPVDPQIAPLPLGEVGRRLVQAGPPHDSPPDGRHHLAVARSAAQQHPHATRRYAAQRQAATDSSPTLGNPRRSGGACRRNPGSESRPCARSCAAVEHKQPDDWQAELPPSCAPTAGRDRACEHSGPAGRIGFLRASPAVRCGDGWGRGTAVPRRLVVAEWEDGQEPFDSRKKPGSYSPATHLPGSSRKAGEMTITLPTEEDLAERPGEPPEHRQRAAAQRPLQRGDNPAVDALADALVLAATKAVDWVFETGARRPGRGVTRPWRIGSLDEQELPLSPLRPWRSSRSQYRLSQLT